MADNQTQLQIVVSAVDNATAELKKIADTMKSGIAPAASAVSSSTDNMTGSVLQGVAAYSALTKAGDAVIGFFKDSIAQAKEAEQVNAQLEAVIRSTGGAAGVTAQQARDLGEALQKTTTFSHEATVSAENMLLTFTNISKDIFPEATKITLDMSTALGQDLKSSAIQLGKALQDPIDGVTALRRVGVNFTQSQQDVIAKLVETGKGAQAQKLILAELTKEFGGSATAAAQTFTGQLEQMQNQFDDLKQEVGEKLMPYLVQFFQLIKENQDTIIATAEVLGGIVVALSAMLIIEKVIAGVQAFNVALGVTGTTVAATLPEVIALAAAMTALIEATKSYNALKNESAAAADSEGEATKQGISVLQEGIKLRSSENPLLEQKGKLLVAIANAQEKNDTEQLKSLKNQQAALNTQISKDKDATAAMDKLKASTIEASTSPDTNFNIPTQGVDKLGAAVKKLESTYQDLKDKTSQSLAELADAERKSLAEIEGNIAKTNADILKLTNDYNQQQIDGKNDLATQIVEAQQKIADDQAALYKETDDDRKQALQKEISSIQGTLQANSSLVGSLNDQVTAAQQRASETDLQRAIDDYNQKNILQKQEYDSKMQALKDELAAENQQQLSILALYGMKQVAIMDLDNQALAAYKSIMEQHKKTTLDTVNAEIEALSALASKVSTIQGASGMNSFSNVTTTQVHDAVITPGGDVIQTDPADYIFATKTPQNLGGGGANINVSINGGVFTSQDSLRILADQIMKLVNNNIKLRTI